MLLFKLNIRVQNDLQCSDIIISNFYTKALVCVSFIYVF